MSHDSQEPASFFSFDSLTEREAEELVRTENVSPAADEQKSPVVELLQQLAEGQQHQTELLGEISRQLGASHRQRASELGHWKQTHPNLARQCRRAAEALSEVQTEFLKNLTDEIDQHSESFIDGDYMLNEFVDRFGPRLAHLNGVLQMLSQLSSTDGPAPRGPGPHGSGANGSGPAGDN